MLTSLCRRCESIISCGKSYCPTCQAVIDKQHTQAKQERNKQYDKNRDKAVVSFYQSKQWKALRIGKLADVGYVCEDCKKENKTSIAEEVHHEEEVSDNWDRRLDYNNLKALCKKCHNKRHGRFC